MNFDIEKFMSFKVNTFAYKNEYGGCIKCAMSHALGLDTGKVSQGFTNQSLMLNTFYKFGGNKFSQLLSDAEGMLQDLAYAHNAKNFDIFKPNVINAEDEAKVKKFVLDGMKELNLIKVEELTYAS